MAIIRPNSPIRPIHGELISMKVPSRPTLPNTPVPGLVWKRELFLGYGQSPITGAIPIPADQTPPVSTAGSLQAYMFEGGMHHHLSDPAGKYDSFVPLEESLLLVSAGTPSAVSYSETFATGHSNRFWQRLGAIGSFPENTDWRPYYSIPGRSGQEIAALEDTATAGEPFEDLMADVAAFTTLCLADGLVAGEFGCRDILFDQGAEDNRINTSGASYRASAIAMRTSLNTRIKAETGQTEDVIVWFVLDNSAPYRGHAYDKYIAHEQLQLCIDFPDHFKWATNQYHNITGVHYEPFQSYVLGCNSADSMFDYRVLGAEKPLLIPTSVEAYDTHGRATYDIPAGHIIDFYTGFPPKQARYGVTVRDNTYALKTQSADPTLVGGNCIDFFTSSPMVTGDTYGYGDPTQGGNARVVPETTLPSFDPIHGYTVNRWILPHEMSITIVGAPLPALDPTPEPPTPPPPPPPPPSYVTPIMSALESVCWCVDVDWTDGVIHDGTTASGIKDALTGVAIVQTTPANEPGYLADGWHDGTPCLTADGLTQWMRSVSVPQQFPAALPIGNAVGEMWFVGKFEASAGDGDAIRDFFAYGAGSGAYRSMRDVIVTGVRRARATINSPTTTNATDLDVNLEDNSGYHWVRLIWDGTNFTIQVDGQTKYTGGAGTLATGATGIALFGSPASGAGQFQGRFKTAFVTNAVLTGADESVAHAICSDYMP